MALSKPNWLCLKTVWELRDADESKLTDRSMRESLCARAEKLRKCRKSCERMDLLWKDFFMDPYLWYDNRSSKVNSERQCRCSEFFFFFFESGLQII